MGTNATCIGPLLSPSSVRLAARDYRAIHTDYRLGPLQTPNLFTKLSTGFSTEGKTGAPRSYMTRTVVA